jgi:hypothetical protein
MDEARNWLVLYDAPDGELQEHSLETLRLVNLDTIRSVDRLGPSHVRLNFSETHGIELHGSAAGELLLTLMERGITVTGHPVPKLKEPSKSPNSA